MSTAPPVHQERMSVPLRWWVQGTMLVATLWLALVVAVPGAVAWGATAIALAVLSGLLWAYGSPRIVVTADELWVGRAHIGAEHLGQVESLDPDEARRAAGVQADARAYFALRPYLRRAVRVEVTDPADPAPYWLVGTRDPDRLAAAIVSLTTRA